MVAPWCELKPDVILVDITMPVLNGLDAGQQIKEILPAVKLIFLTMNNDVKLAERGISSRRLRLPFENLCCV